MAGSYQSPPPSEFYDELSGADDEDAAWTEFARRAAPYCRRPIADLHAVLDDRSMVDETDPIAAAALVRHTIGSAKIRARQNRAEPETSA
jgi:hypothetical protein